MSERELEITRRAQQYREFEKNREIAELDRLKDSTIADVMQVFRDTFDMRFARDKDVLAAITDFIHSKEFAAVRWLPKREHRGPQSRYSGENSDES